MAGKVGKHPFGMPLDTENGKFFMDNAFDDTVIGGLYHGQVLSEVSDCLVVGAVGKRMKPVNVCEEGIRLYTGGMQFIAVIPCVAAGFFDMLDDSAAQADIDNLHSFTDAKHRTFPLEEKVQCLKLENIQFHINVFGTLVILPEKGWRDVAASRQQKPVKCSQAFGIQSGKKNSAHGTQGIFVVTGVFASSQDGDFRVFVHDGCSFRYGIFLLMGGAAVVALSRYLILHQQKQHHRH